MQLGPLALLNRRIGAALEQWCAQPYLHPHQLAAHPEVCVNKVYTYVDVPTDRSLVFPVPRL